MNSELEYIKEAYYEINNDILYERNTIETRFETIQKLILTLNKSLYHARVICDESNNPPDVIDSGLMVARVEWLVDRFDKDVKYIDLHFGAEDIIWDEPKQR